LRWASNFARLANITSSDLIWEVSQLFAESKCSILFDGLIGSSVDSRVTVSESTQVVPSIVIEIVARDIGRGLTQHLWLHNIMSDTLSSEKLNVVADLRVQRFFVVENWSVSKGDR